MSEIVVKYIASSGNEYELKTDPWKIASAAFHTYSWGKSTTKIKYGVRLEEFSKEAQNYETTLYLVGSENENRKALKALHDDFERDIFSKTPGKFVFNNDYIYGYVLESSTAPTEGNQWVENKLKIFCPSPFWISEQLISLRPVERSGDSAQDPWLDYTFDYPFEYSHSVSESYSTIIDYYTDVAFKMIIYGPIVSPSIQIGNNVYSVNCVVADGEYLTIDSRDTTPRDQQVFITKQNGSKINVFDLRDPNHQILKRIPSGSVTITYPRTYGVDIYLFKERSEPDWTI